MLAGEYQLEYFVNKKREVQQEHSLSLQLRFKVDAYSLLATLIVLLSRCLDRK